MPKSQLSTAPSTHLQGKVSFITGASSGIGRALCLWLASEGAHVIGLSRNLPALEELDDEIKAGGGTMTIVQANLTAGDKIMSLGPALLEKFDRLDHLISCAGTLGPQSPLGHVKEKDWQAAYKLNATSNLHLIQMADPLLRRADRGKAIFLTDALDTPLPPFTAAYCSSKAALNGLVGSYVAQTAHTNVSSFLLDPGPTNTKFRAKLFPGEKPDSQKPPTDLIPLVRELLLGDNYQSGDLIRYEIFAAKE